MSMNRFAFFQQKHAACTIHEDYPFAKTSPKTVNLRDLAEKAREEEAVKEMFHKLLFTIIVRSKALAMTEESRGFFHPLFEDLS